METNDIIEQAAPQPAIESLEAYEAQRSNPSKDKQAAEPEQKLTPETPENAGDSETEKAEKPKRDRTAEGRIAELTRKAKELEQERDDWRRRAETPTPAPEQPKAQPKPNADGKPTLKEFVANLGPDESYEDAQERWADAVQDWREQQARKRSEEAQTVAKQQEKATKVISKIEEARAKFSDFDEVTQGNWIPNAPGEDLVPALSSFLVDDGDPAILYHLATNIEEAKRIAKLPPARQLAELGKLEDRISKPEPKPTAPVSKAPAPIRNVSGTAPEAENDLSKAKNLEDFVRIRSKR